MFNYLPFKKNTNCFILFLHQTFFCQRHLYSMEYNIANKIKEVRYGRFVVFTQNQQENSHHHFQRKQLLEYDLSRAIRLNFGRKKSQISRIFKKFSGDEFESQGPHILDSNHQYTYLNPCKNRICKINLKRGFQGGLMFAPPPPPALSPQKNSPR